MTSKMRSRAGSPARSSLVPSSTCRSIWREKRAEHRALGGKEIAKLGERYLGGLRDVGDLDLVPGRSRRSASARDDASRRRLRDGGRRGGRFAGHGTLLERLASVGGSAPAAKRREGAGVGSWSVVNRQSGGAED